MWRDAILSKEKMQALGGIHIHDGSHERPVLDKIDIEECGGEGNGDRAALDVAITDVENAGNRIPQPLCVGRCRISPDEQIMLMRIGIAERIDPFPMGNRTDLLRVAMKTVSLIDRRKEILDHDIEPRKGEDFLPG